MSDLKDEYVQKLWREELVNWDFASCRELRSVMSTPIMRMVLRSLLDMIDQTDRVTATDLMSDTGIREAVQRAGRAQGMKDSLQLFLDLAFDEEKSDGG